jgi:hypothetical protein
MAYITAGDYYRLLAFLRGQDQFRLRTISSREMELFNLTILESLDKKNDHFVTVPFEIPSVGADCIVRPSDGVDFRAHKLILTLQTDLNVATSKSLLENLAVDDLQVDDLPIIAVQETGGIVANFFSYAIRDAQVLLLYCSLDF